MASGQGATQLPENLPEARSGEPQLRRHDGRARHPEITPEPVGPAEAEQGGALLHRLRRLLTDRVVPQLAARGFAPCGPSLVADRGETCWILDPEVALWSTPDRLSFTIAWGVHVHGLDEVLDDAVVDGTSGGGEAPDGEGPRLPRAWDCPLGGRLGQPADGLEAHWFAVRSLPGPPALAGPVLAMLDARTAMAVVGGVATEVLPRLRRLESLPMLQHAMVGSLKRRRGAPSDGELRLIRNVAGISLLLGEKANATMWLDYLAARSAAAMAPDVVAERLAPLRLRCAG